MKKIIIFGLFCVSLMILGCGDSGNSGKTADNGNDSGREMGSLYGECYPNETCDKGLECDVENNICLKESENSENPNNTDTTSENTEDKTDTESEISDNESDSTTDKMNDSGDSIPDDSDSSPDNSDSTPDDGNSLAPTPCNPNPCESIANATGICVITGADSTNYYCGCENNYTFDDASKICKANNRVVSCRNLPKNAEWNTVESITQTWNGSEWIPSMNGTYDTNSSDDECRFICETNFNWTGSECVAATQNADCIGLPENAEWNTAESIKQTWVYQSWQPTNTGKYGKSSSSSECIFKCREGYFWTGTECNNQSRKVISIGHICTGINKCYDDEKEIDCDSLSETDPYYGQDAHYASKVCIPQNFSVKSVSGQKIIFDNNTGLQWQGIEAEKHTWEDAVNHCNNLTYAGYSDWRLPTPQELLTIVDISKKPALNSYFTNLLPSGATWSDIWSSKIYKPDTKQAWYLWAYYGSFNRDSKTDENGTICVRGEELPIPTLTDSIVDGRTVTHDSVTGFMWTELYACTWRKALSYCENLNFAGYSDWRLPNRNEINSLVNYDNSTHGTYFDSFPVSPFWSSSTSDTATNAWGLNGSPAKSQSWGTICVR